MIKMDSKEKVLEWILKDSTYDWYTRCCEFNFTKGDKCTCSSCVIRILLEHINEIKNGDS